MRRPRLLLLYLLLGLLAACRPGGFSGAERLPERVDYNFHVKPILSDRCYACHGPDAEARQADLRLDTEAGALDTPLESGEPAIVPGSLRKSVLYHRITSDDPAFKMPPPESKLALSTREIALINRWIDQGAAWKPHWAFTAPIKPPLPEVTDADWPRNPIDHFVLARLDQERLSPSPEAAKETLLRRVTLDLTGLPPTLDALDAFLADTSSHAYEHAVDRLLASPQYGERWSWDWLDAARYADTNGYQGDPVRTMWPWRDWVVRAINANMPYDQFTIEQLAGDLLPKATRDQILATGFNRNHMYNGEGGRIPEETRVENVFDRVETVGTVWMGLTVTCSRCHDHKYDPITQREYYQLFDYFNQTSEEGSGFNGKVDPVIDLSPPEDRARVAVLQDEVDRIASEVEAMEQALFPHGEGETAADSPNAEGLIGENVDALRLRPSKRSGYYLGLLIKAFAPTEPGYARRLTALNEAVRNRDRQAAQNTRVMVMDEREVPRETFILTRGLYNKPTEKVVMDVPAFLPSLPEAAPASRLTLARWLVSPDHPLTARVTVNRFWQAFFGTGLVKTVEDFGVQGALPSHPGLLDWLAVDFVESGWDVQALHKQIVMSATYRQASRITPALLERDPENRLLARGPRHRLASWMMRDQALAAGGLLVDSIGGPPVYPYQPEGIWAEATFGQKTYQQDHGDALYRRTLYTFWRRIVGPPMLFDNATRQTCTVNANRTNTPLHALTTLNDITYMEAARFMAERVMTAAATDDARIVTAFRLATARLPSPDEQAILRKRLATLRHQYDTDPEAAAQLLAVGEAPRNEQLDAVEHAAFTGLCSLILNLDETITKQ